jgi:hypothetical protein
LRLVFYGFLSWLPVFAVATAAQMWRDSDFGLFQAVVVIAMTAVTVSLAPAILGELKPLTLKDGLVCGLTWMIVHALLGLLAFVGGPLEMPMAHFRSLALCMLVIPLLTVGLAYEGSRRGRDVPS